MRCCEALCSRTMFKFALTADKYEFFRAPINSFRLYESVLAKPYVPFCEDFYLMNRRCKDLLRVCP